MLSLPKHLYRFLQTVQRGDRDASTPLRCAQHDDFRLPKQLQLLFKSLPRLPVLLPPPISPVFVVDLVVVVAYSLE